MKQIKILLQNDLRRLVEYKILHIITALSVLLSAFMAFYRNFDLSIYIYLSMFVIPVILFAISLFIEKEENSFLPDDQLEFNKFYIVLSKVISALLFQLIPFFLYTIVMVFIYHLSINYLLFLLAFLLGSLLHILVGLSLAIIAKTNRILSIHYLIYIIIFSSLPFFYTNQLIPLQFEYALIVSPAYLSGILIDNILIGRVYSDLLLLVLSVVLQIVYILLMIYYIVKPFIAGYISHLNTKK